MLHHSDSTGSELPVWTLRGKSKSRKDSRLGYIKIEPLFGSDSEQVQSAVADADEYFKIPKNKSFKSGFLTLSF